jgi:hypothetical protein
MISDPRPDSLVSSCDPIQLAQTKSFKAITMQANGLPTWVVSSGGGHVTQNVVQRRRVILSILADSKKSSLSLCTCTFTLSGPNSSEEITGVYTFSASENPLKIQFSCSLELPACSALLSHCMGVRTPFLSNR